MYARMFVYSMHLQFALRKTCFRPKFNLVYEKHTRNNGKKSEVRIKDELHTYNGLFYKRKARFSPHFFPHMFKVSW